MPTNKPEVVLPELPNCYRFQHPEHLYTVNQMRAYGQACIDTLARPADEVTAGDAVFAFAGLLTTLPHVVPFGAAAWATPGADLAAAFNAANGLTVSNDFPQGLVFPKIEGELLDRVKQASEVESHERPAAGDFVLVPRAAIERAIATLEGDGDEHGVAAMLAGANPQRGRAAYPMGSDREVLAYLMQQFDAETWECPQCGYAEDTASMDSADYLRRYLSANPAPQQGERGVGSYVDALREAARIARNMPAQQFLDYGKGPRLRKTNHLHAAAAIELRADELSTTPSTQSQQRGHDMDASLGAAYMLGEMERTGYIPAGSATEREAASQPQHPAEAVAGEDETVYTLSGLITYGKIAGAASQGAVPNYLRSLVRQMVPYLEVLRANSAATRPPAIDIGKLRELVERWRVSEREADTQHRKQTCYEIDFSDRARSETYERCADELAALIGGGGEAGNG